MSSNRFKQAMYGYPKENVTDIKTAGITKIEEEPIVADMEQSTPSTSESTDISDVGISSTGQSDASNYINDYVTDTLSDKAADIELFTSPMREEEPQPAVYQAAVPVVQHKYSGHDAAYSESVSARPAKNVKKNVPNMFTQKNESKSIRKSLVLRPSSVKIAENYCAKNGGSFNELIQILLDNFMGEYGL